MCDPVTASLVIAGVSAALTVNGQMQAAEQQKDAIENSARLQNETLAKQYEQMQKQGTDEVSQAARAAMIEQARMRVSAGESGVAGLTVDSIFGSSEFNAAEAIAGIQRNTYNAKDQSALEGRGMYSKNKSMANSIKQPDWLGAGLQVAGAGAANWDYLSAKWGGSQTQAPAPVVERSINR